jgi:hypothetical protein
MNSIGKYVECLFDPVLAVPAAKVALLVGTILLLINHAEALLQDNMSGHRWVSGLLSYVVPYMVSIHGRFSARNKIQP